MSSLSCRRAAGRGLRLLLIVQMLCTGYGVLSLTNHQLNPVQQCTASTSDVGCDTRPLVALVLARSGSKAVPLKNLRTVGGLSLLAHSLLAIRRSGVFGEVWVSTDHVAIAQEAEQYGAQVHYRPAAVAQDNTTSIASVQEFLVRHPHVQNVALVQCTSVFLRAEYLRIAQRLFDEAVDRPGVTVDCVFAVVRSFKLRWQWLHDQQKLVAVNFDPVRRPRRQDWFGELVETGMFYVATRQLLESGRFQNERCRFVEVVAEDALEIDTLDDLNMANILYENRMKTHPATSD